MLALVLLCGRCAYLTANGRPYRTDRRGSACQLWALAHIVHPHPSRSEKESLAAYTGKSTKQVRDALESVCGRCWDLG